MDAKEQTVKIVLKKLFNQNHFSICEVDNLMRITNTIPDPGTYQLLHAVHCVHYKDMDKEYRDWLFKTVVNMFTDNGFRIDIIDNMIITDAGRIIDIQAPVAEIKKRKFLNW